MGMFLENKVPICISKIKIFKKDHLRSAFLRKPQKFAQSSSWFLVNVQTMRKIAHIFMAFSEKLNFNTMSNF